MQPELGVGNARTKTPADHLVTRSERHQERGRDGVRIDCRRIDVRGVENVVVEVSDLVRLADLVVDVLGAAILEYADGLLNR